MAYTYHDLIRDLRDGPYAWPGGYPKFFLFSDGGVGSFQAVKADLWQCARATRDGYETGFAIVGCSINWEDHELYCDLSGERIESAYAEPEEASNGS